jgi:aspartyl-tRNA(Asn)/glutamyl-tRNA(Gln) amidotransferase subunit A
MKTYTDFCNQIKNNKTTCLEEVTFFLNNIEKNKHLNSFLQVNNEEVLVAAKESDKYFANSKPRKLEGMVVGIKDNISVRGLKATCASKMLMNYQPVYDATIIKKIKAEGGIIIGKTNMDELAMGSSNETSYFGNCKNPVNNDFVSGGSSGGSAVAVAAELAHTTLGSDTGGSIRQPASFCGTVGFKPTYGRISRYGLIAFASSLDHIGTFSANIDDTALLFDVMSGIDEFDSTTANLPQTNTFEKINEPIPAKFTVGLLPDSILQKCSEDVLKVYSKQLENLKTIGAEFHTLDFNFINVCVPTYIVLTTSEASSNLARLDGIKYGHRSQSFDSKNDFNYNTFISTNRGEGFGSEVIRRLLFGVYMLANGNSKDYYSKAQKIRTAIRKNVNDAFSKVDLFFLPTASTVAFKSNEKDADRVSMYLSDFFTTSANLAGNPAISIPLGTGANNLPIGMQLQANSWEEEKLFRFSKLLMNFNNYNI